MVDIEATFGIRTSTTSEDGVKDFCVEWSRASSGDDGDNFSVCTTFLEQPTHGYEVKYFTQVPAFQECASKLGRIKVVEEPVRLQHCQNASFGRKLHCLVKK
jgi:hypothetical protein